MICYKDMTFCTFYEGCKKANDCHRPLTPMVKDDAAIWAFRFFKDDKIVPISVFMEKPACHEAIEEQHAEP